VRCGCSWAQQQDTRSPPTRRAPSTSEKECESLATPFAHLVNRGSGLPEALHARGGLPPETPAFHANPKGVPWGVGFR
jgi:hypothetical protein